MIDAIVKDQPRKQSAAAIEKLNRETKAKNKGKEGTYKPFTKNPVLSIIQAEQVKQKVTPPIQNLMLIYENGVKQ